MSIGPIFFVLSPPSPPRYIARLHVLGAMKAGSSSIYTLFIQPQPKGAVCGSLEPSFHDKEPRIWYNSSGLKTAAPDRYFSSWPQPGTATAARLASCRDFIDANPVRLKGAFAPASLWRFAHASALQPAQLRLVAVVREPIARYLSWYNHRLNEPELFRYSSMVYCPRAFADKRLRAVPSFATLARCELEAWRRSCGDGQGASASACFDAQAERYGAAMGVAESLFGPQLARWTRVWPRRQLLVVQFERLRQRGAAFADAHRRMAAFFGLPPPRPVDALPHTNEQGSPCKLKGIPCNLRGTLQAFFRPWNDAFNAELARAHAAGQPPPEEVGFQITDSPVACYKDDMRPSINLSSCRRPTASISEHGPVLPRLAPDG